MNQQSQKFLLPLFVFILLRLAPLALHGQNFTDVTSDVGIEYNQYATSIQGLFDPFHMTGGAAVADFNNDGWIDLFVTRMDAPGILYRNRNGSFEAVSALSIGITITSWANGPIWGDVDNDGDQDLYITTVNHSEGRNFLYINQGNGTFVEEAITRNADVQNLNPQTEFGIFAYSAALGDYDLDGYLDLYTTTWADFGTTEPVSHPGGVGTRLLRNLGDQNPGFFEDVTEAAGVAMNDVPNLVDTNDVTMAFAPRFTDLDNDGYPDLAIASDFGTSRLFWNNGDGRFTDGTVAARVGTDENGMGSTVGDYDGDGRLDWFVTSIFGSDENSDGPEFGRTGNRLFRNLGNRRFKDVTDVAGVRDGGWGWGTTFFDYDNDGDLDLIMTNGVIFSGSQPGDLFSTDRMRLWRNNGDGTFSEIGEQEGIIDTRPGKGLLTFNSRSWILDLHP